MSFKTSIIVLIIISSLLVVGDFILNDYNRFFQTTKGKGGVIATNTLQSQLPQSFKDILPKDVVIQKPIMAKTLFSRLDVSVLQLDESIQTTLQKGIQKYGIVYEFSGEEKIYFQLKSALELILEKDDSVFDANNIGDYSLYYNDKKRTETVFFLSLINGRIWGFEYPREYHETYKKLIKTLVKSQVI